MHGIWIFVGVVAISMASKYLIRWHGRHIFNPSNLGLVIAFVALGPQYTEPQDLWWIPMGPWMIVTYAILVGGGLFIALGAQAARARARVHGGVRAVRRDRARAGARPLHGRQLVLDAHLRAAALADPGHLARSF